MRYKIIVTALFLFTTVSCFLAKPNTTSALSGSEFSAGNIIDNQVFFNPTSMSIGDVQNFLNAKVPVCDTWGTQAYGGTTRAAYGASRGHPTPFVCLKDARHFTNYKTPDSYCAGFVAGDLTSAEIIYHVAQSCGISPKVLIILLQKEQSLVTDDWPWSIQYRSATGYGCPDTAACDSDYYGFFNQVYAAARVYKYYAANPTQFNYRAGINNYILYNPNTACGGSTVFVQNQATAGLYVYTPYQPNASALANLYGTGDSCGAYGNRNFWRMYRDWFGNTTGPGYEFVDAVNPTQNILPNDVQGAVIRIRNRSGMTWYSDGNVPSGQRPFRLATVGYENTPYANTGDPAWLGTSNQIRMKETSVADGQVATFEFTFRAPIHQVNTFWTRFAPVFDGANFLPYTGLSYITSTPAPNFNYSVVASSGFTNSIPPNYTRPVSYTVRNTGNIVWWGENNRMPGAYPLRMFTINPFYHSSSFYDSSSWLASNQIKLSNDSRLNPGQDANFSFNLRTPSTSGSYSESFGLILDGATPYPSDNQMSFSTNVGNYSYSLVSSNLPTQLIPGQRYDSKITITNTGSLPWYADANTPPGTNPIRLINSGYRAHPFYTPSDSNWFNSSQIKMTTPVVNPGENAEFNFSFTVPYDSSGYYNDFKVVLDGVSMMPGFIQQNTTIPNKSASYSQQPGGIHPAGTPLAPGQVSNGKLILKNTSNFIWYNDDSKPNHFRGGATRLVMVSPYYRPSPFANLSNASWLSNSQIKMTTPVVNPGENAEFDLVWKAPSQPGIYKDKFSLVVDGYLLFPDIGMELSGTVR